MSLKLLKNSQSGGQGSARKELNKTRAIQLSNTHKNVAELVKNSQVNPTKVLNVLKRSKTGEQGWR